MKTGKTALERLKKLCTQRWEECALLEKDEPVNSWDNGFYSGAQDAYDLVLEALTEELERLGKKK